MRGVTDFLLLSIINELPSHGHQIVKELGRSQGYFKFKSNTIYPALCRLEVAGWSLVAGNRLLSGRGAGIMR
ncbi:MAG TPA: hypothetical protein G4O12_00295 [Dehalococcoidia bacterium]|nr:hypothetical protein [Dehalococcoidia bacterium]